MLNWWGVMRDFWLVCLLLSSIACLSEQGLSAAEAADDSGAIAQTVESRESEDFWNRAKRLTQDQIDVMARIESAIVSAEPTQVQAARSQLIRHLGAIDRFLEERYYSPRVVCDLSRSLPIPRLGAPALTVEQKPVYCALYASSRALTPLIAILNERQRKLAGQVENEPLPYPVLPGVPRWEQAPPPAPNFPPPEPPVIGRPKKTPIADYKPPIRPAIVSRSTPPPQALAAAKLQLNRLQSAFPRGTEFVNPQQPAETNNRNAGQLDREEPENYADFLALPGTGVAIVSTAPVNRLPPNSQRNRLAPPRIERMSLPPLYDIPPAERAKNPFQKEDFIPRLTVEIVGGKFQTIFSDLNYGFLVDLGNVPIEKLDLELSRNRGFRLPPAVRWFFLYYQPPEELQQLQADQRRFLTGKLDDFILTMPVQRETLAASSGGIAEVPIPQPAPAWQEEKKHLCAPLAGVFCAPQISPPPTNPDRLVLNAAPVVLNHTYLMRSLQFQVPEIILNDQPISRRQRRYLNLILETPSSDLLIAFRPVRRRDDGSYTVLWRILGEFPAPQIRDLYQYVDLY